MGIYSPHAVDRYTVCIRCTHSGKSGELEEVAGREGVAQPVVRHYRRAPRLLSKRVHLKAFDLRVLVYLVIYDSVGVPRASSALEVPLPESIKHFHLKAKARIWP